MRRLKGKFNNDGDEDLLSNVSRGFELRANKIRFDDVC